MSAVYSILICVAGAVLASVLRRERPEIALMVSIASGTAAVAVCLPELTQIVQTARELGEGAGLNTDSVKIMLKGAGIALLAEFASQVCADAGEGALAGRIELGARLALIAMALPLISQALSSLYSLLSF